VVVVPHPGDTQDPIDLSGASGARVLVVDRRQLFLAAFGTLLASPPVSAQVFVATTTDAGLELAVAAGVQLVFCEVKAEPFPAVEMAERLANLTPKIPVILLGEPGDEKEMAAALHGPVAGVFTKDADLNEFLAGVRAVLSGHRAVGSNLMSRVLEGFDGSVPKERGDAGRLSPTEREILTLIGEARSIPFIAERRGISRKTVRNHVANIYRKLELRSRTEAMLCAARMGLTHG
jgi:DNA-binding NarL/FixJ family response regulator